MPTAKLLPSGRYRTQVIDHYDYVPQSDGTVKKVPRYASFTSSQTGMKGKRESEAMASEFLMGKRQRKTESKTLRVAIDQYIEDHKNVLSPSTINGYEWMKRFAFTDIMDMDIAKLDTRTLIAAVNKEALRENQKNGRKGTISAKTVKNEWGLLSATLNYFDVDYTDIFFEEDAMVIYNESECQIFTTEGVEKYRGNFNKSVRLMLPAGGSYKYYLVTDNTIDTIQLK